MEIRRPRRLHSLDIDYFPATDAAIYWSAISSAEVGSDAAWGLNFDDGSVDVYPKAASHAVRLVRAAH